jgi:hypothetical protein
MNAVLGGALLRGAETAANSPIVTGTSVPGAKMRAHDGGKGIPLPMNFMVALTPTAFRVFKIRKTWTGLKIKKELGTLPRDGLQVETTDGGVTKTFSLNGTDGSSITFEMTRSKFATTFADDLRAALA